MRVKFVLEGSFLLPKHLTVGFSNNEFLNIFVIQEKKIITDRNVNLKKKLPQIFSKICVSLKSKKEEATTETQPFCEFYIFDRKKE